MKTDQPHWYIIGAGAIGCLWAYALKQAGYSVTVIVRSHDTNVKKTPHSRLQRISLSSSNKGLDYADVNTLTVNELIASKAVIEHGIIATKAYDAQSALSAIVPALSPSAKILSLCNGMGMHDAMHQQLQNHSKKIQFLLGVTSDGALLQQAFQLTHTGVGHTYIGHYDQVSNNLLHTKTALSAHGLLPPTLYLQHTMVDDIHSALWQKMLINCVINPLTVIYQCKNGELFSNKAYVPNIQALCEELSNIAHAAYANSTLNTSTTTATTLFNAAQAVATKTALNTSSMLKDAQQGRQLELHYINGYMVKLAQDNGIACPINQQLLNKLL